MRRVWPHLLCFALLVWTGSALSSFDSSPTTEVELRPATNATLLSDGALFVPKPGQFQLGLQAMVVEPANTRRSVVLDGTVIGAPDGTGEVAANQAGVFELDRHHLPVPGTVVHRGERLGWLHITVSAAKRAQLEESLEHARQLEKMKKQELRMASYATTGAVGRNYGIFQLEMLKGEIDALKARVKALKAAQNRRIPLRAPIDGVIAKARLRSGDAVGVGQQIIQVIDPKKRWLEVYAYRTHRAEDPVNASARDQAGHHYQLKFVGQGVGRPDGTVPWYYRIDPPKGASGDAEIPRLGDGLVARVEMGAEQHGIVVPRDAIVSDPQGRPEIWVQEQAERFEPRAVATRRLSRNRLLIEGDVVEPGERVVTQGAWLLSQLQ